MKPGDWLCPQCGDLQFAKNAQCRKCGEPNPDPESSKAAMEAGIASGTGGNTEKPGDWWCPACGDLQFAKNAQCRKCGAPNPDPEGSLAAASASGAFKGTSEKKPGDWYCSKCGDLQFAKNVVCRQCGAPNPMKMLGMAGGNAGDNSQMEMLMNMMGGNMGGNKGGGWGGGKGGKNKWNEPEPEEDDDLDGAVNALLAVLGGNNRGGKKGGGKWRSNPY